MEERNTKLETLRQHLGEGTQQAASGEFVAETLEEMLGAFKAEHNAKKNLKALNSDTGHEFL